MKHITLEANIPSLTGLRAVAAMSVVFYHFTMRFETIGPFPNIFRNGWLGVDLFFVLSGFVIHHVYQATFERKIDRTNFARFLWLRLARIYPVHIVTLFIALALSLTLTALGFQSSREYDYFTGTLAAMLLMHGWLGIVGPNYVSWSVSAEWFAYLCYPALCWVSSRMNARHTAAAAIAIIGVMHLNGEQNVLIRVLTEFAAGMITYKITARLRSFDRQTRWIGLTAVLAGLLWGLLRDHASVVIHVLIFCTIILGITQPGDILGRVLSTRPFEYLGEISYSLYLIHSLVASGFRLIVIMLPFQLSDSTGFMIQVGLSLAAAAILFHLIELPARALLRQYAPSPRTQGMSSI
jgi:peptidoglycan/LPS O-acetylase OafA/YrhL